jgi:D-arabinose 1-dehydrogenase-like Zn-dependent alcohol dehydrogenase
MEAASTYCAMQVVSQGRLELTEKTLQAPGPGRVRIRVEACESCVSLSRQLHEASGRPRAARPAAVLGSQLSALC